MNNIIEIRAEIKAADKEFRRKLKADEFSKSELVQQSKDHIQCVKGVIAEREQKYSRMKVDGWRKKSARDTIETLKGSIKTHEDKIEKLEAQIQKEEAAN